MNTEGFACPNHQCLYFGITDAHIHALVGDGKHGQAERIQTFRGPACRTTFTRPSQHPHVSSENSLAQIAVVLSALAEGLDPSAAERVAGLPTSHHHQPFSLVLGNMHRPCTKLLPVLHLGPRTQNMAHTVIHALRQSLAAFLSSALYQ